MLEGFGKGALNLLIQYDWFLFQIQLLALAIARIVFGKGSLEYETENEEIPTATDYLHRRLLELLARKRICEAENLLFDSLDPHNKSGLALALDFYDRLNKMTDEELEQNDFSREEIDSGLRDVIKLYELSIPNL